MQDIKEILKEYKQQTNDQIKKRLAEQKNVYGSIGTTSMLALDRLEEFSLGGKGIRGSLSILVAEMFGSKEKNILLDIAATLEILQAALLIHDDIMDNDLLRRGNPSLFAQYIENSKRIEAADSLHYGRSMGICVGDIAFFIALSICNDSLKNHSQKEKIMSLLFKELTIVGLAQMDDVTFAASKKFPTSEEILRMYLYKTAHYTFSLPLSLGAIMANQSDETVKQVEKLGEHIGLLFQIKDDEIGVYSSSKDSGKPLGSDLRENKKTLLRTLLNNKMTSDEENQLLEIQRKQTILEENITFYLYLLEKYSIKKEVNDIVNNHKQEAEQIITKLSIEEKNKELLRELVTFVSHRNS